MDDQHTENAPQGTSAVDSFFFFAYFVASLGSTLTCSGLEEPD